MRTTAVNSRWHGGGVRHASKLLAPAVRTERGDIHGFAPSSGPLLRRLLDRRARPGQRQLVDGFLAPWCVGTACARTATALFKRCSSRRRVPASGAISRAWAGGDEPEVGTSHDPCDSSGRFSMDCGAVPMTRSADILDETGLGLTTQEGRQHESE